jgi:hypothetical protein
MVLVVGWGRVLRRDMASRKRHGTSSSVAALVPIAVALVACVRALLIPTEHHTSPPRSVQANPTSVGLRLVISSGLGATLRQWALF